MRGWKGKDGEKDASSCREEKKQEDHEEEMKAKKEKEEGKYRSDGGFLTQPTRGSRPRPPTYPLFLIPSN